MDKEIEDLLTPIKTYIQSCKKRQELSDTEIEKQRDALEKKAKFVHMILSLIITVSILSMSLSLIWKTPPKGVLSIIRNLIIAVSCGAIGSGISALRSSLQRKANGWAFKNGAKDPLNGPNDRFSMRMSSFFLYRPILGIVAALLVYAMIEGKIVIIEKPTEFHLVFWCILSGLFAKTLFQKLNDLFKSFVPGKG